MDFDAEAKAFGERLSVYGNVEAETKAFVSLFLLLKIMDYKNTDNTRDKAFVSFDAEAKASVDDYYNTRDRLVRVVRAGLESLYMPALYRALYARPLSRPLRNCDAEMKAFVDDYNNTHKDRLSSYGSMPASKGQKIQGIMDRDRKVRAFVRVVPAGPESLSSYGSMPASEGQNIQGNFRKLGIMDRDRKVRAFVEHYYNIFDTCRAGLVVLYQDGAMLTLEGSKFQGVQAIVGVLSSQFFQQCKHNISTFDCQPSGPGGGMLIFVSGTLQLLGEQHQLKFSQMFHLMPAQWGGFLVFNDIFRLNYDA